MIDQFQSTKTETKVGILSKVIISLSLTSLGLIVAGIIMGVMSSMK